MAVALVGIIAIGLLASVSPSTLVVFIMLLFTARPTGNAVGFLFGWTLSLVVVFSIVFAASGTASRPHSGGHTVTAAAEILLGAVMAVVAVRVWRRRNRPKAPRATTGRLEARAKQLRPWQSAAIGVAEQPWTLTAAAALILVHHDIGPAVTAFGFLLFTACSTAGVVAVFAYHAWRPDVSEARLAALRGRLTQLGPTLVASVSLLVSAFLVADGLLALIGG